MLGEDFGYWPLLKDALESGQIVGPRVHDARIASICLSHGVSELWTADRDFSYFPALHARNPLVGSS
jgi:predicted nucleic acid-binding protein